MRLIVFGSLTILWAAWTAGCSKQIAATASGPPAAPVRVAPAVSKTVPVEVRAVGNVEAYSTIVIKSQVGGVLQRVHFHEGEAVRKGDLLFEIDSRPYEQAVRQWEANLARDQALLRQAQANMARDQAQRKYADDQAHRYSRLQAEGVISREQAEMSRTDAEARSEAVRADQAAIESLSASIRADQASLEKARVDLGYCRIYAPVDGRTGNVMVNRAASSRPPTSNWSASIRSSPSTSRSPFRKNSCPGSGSV